jgi:uncharacterized alkaline shock family protein YloU
MGIINRFLLFVYALCIGAVSVVVAGVCLNLIPERMWLNEVRFAIARPDVLAVLAIVILISLYMLKVSLSTKESPRERVPAELMLADGENGKVRVSAEAVQSLAERAAATIKGVREANVRIKPMKVGDTSVALAINVVLSHGISVPDVGERVSEVIRQEMSDSLNLSDTKVDVSVTDISNAPVDRKRVV